MIINKFDGIVAQVIDAVNEAHSHGPCLTTYSIELTRAEMNEFMEKHPFKGSTGKFYGDDMRGSLLEVTRRESAWADPMAPIMSFRLYGVLVYVPAGE